jgi:hypothetical protein
MNPKMSQVWRVVRLFAITFAFGVLFLDDQTDKTALLGLAVGALEGGYRAVFPPGNQRLVHVIAELIARLTVQEATPPQEPPTAAQSSIGAATPIPDPDRAGDVG